MPDDRRRPVSGAIRGRGSARSAYRHSSELDSAVLTILGSSKAPLGAYAIARRSKATGTPLAPNQVYRILDRLEAQAKIRRVESLNAFCAVRGPPGPIMLCRHCGGVSLLAVDPQQDVARLCRAAGFHPDRFIVEVIGRCRDCSPSGAD